ncbi:uncharacterized protein J4E79_009793 [Alternaria viburni]|uniref:uncharacterized protein n=1 Tax=Alternaria viburni TaxID=566460 RepID=UPI0020C549DB|nr:uncharacterized protein J4E79_009793 [Alternaria viburni]KAI4648722.1 hypothetical protein J4E79_009793 [Alternaria viburni]
MARKRKVADEKPSSTGSTPQPNSTMARKRKVADEKPTSNGSTPQPNGAKKRKIDWSTVDKDLSFKITAVTVRKHKKPSKSAKSKQGAVNGGHVSEFDAPLDAETTQPNPYPKTQLPELHVKIKPALYWEAMRRYRRFTVNGEEFEVGQMIFVKKSEEDKIAEGPGTIEHWIAKVLEVRGGDPEHVFLRVYWAYRPEDIPGGRQAHHGDSELIVSNHMDIIDALSVDSSADVVYWDDDPESLDLKTDQLFFRQSYDITKRANSQLSKMKTYCIDKKPCNPDELLLQCPQCSEWLHADCLKKRALQDAAPQLKKRGRPSQVQASTTLDARIKAQDNKARLTILERRGGKPKRKWDVDILCLVCGGMVEEASEKAYKEVPETAGSQFGSDISEDDKHDIIPTASMVAKPPVQDDDADSVMGDAESDQDVEAKDPPGSDAEIKGETVETPSSD